MREHTHTTLVDGCARCELNRDEMAMLDAEDGDTATILADEHPEDADDPTYIKAPMPEDAFDQLVRVIVAVAADVWCEVRFSNLIWDAIGSPTPNTRFMAWLADEWGRWENGYDDPKVYLDHVARQQEYGQQLLLMLRDTARKIDPQGDTINGRWRYRCAYDERR